MSRGSAWFLQKALVMVRRGALPFWCCRAAVTAWTSRVSACLLLGAVVIGCGDPATGSSFERPAPEVEVEDAGADAGAAPDEESLIGDNTGPSSTSDPNLGGPCVDDAQCEDGVECTFDECDAELQRCRSVPDDALCQDESFCNGVEVCDLSGGCRAGEAVSCDDQTACTVDRCVEDERACEHEPRDADADGDVDARCPGGSDCNDDDPAVAGTFEEICGNERDDDCDREMDETDCTSPDFDDCSAPFEIDASGTFLLSTQALAAQFSSECAPEAARDLVVSVHVDGEPADLVFTLTATDGELALAELEDCDAMTTGRCEVASEGPGELPVARLLLPAREPGRHRVVLFSSLPQDLELAVAIEPVGTEVDNETCQEPRRLEPGAAVEVDLLRSGPDVVSRCGTGKGDQVFRFQLADTSDVRVFAASLDGWGEPMLSLRGAECDGDEVRCVQRRDAELFARALPAGEHHLAVSATVPTRLSLLLQVSGETPAPAGEDCLDPPLLPHNRTTDVQLDDFTDDVDLGCFVGGRDAAFLLELDEPSDVMLVQRIAASDEGAVALGSSLECTDATLLGCAQGDESPLRFMRHRLLPGSYAAVAESAAGAPVQVTAFVRPAAAPILATLAEDCDSVLDIPRDGGAFQGNTASAKADFSASCDTAGVTLNGAGDHILRLRLDERKRVVFDMSGSATRTLLDLREGPECPGREIACVSTFEQGRAYLDIELSAGEYFVQVDGFGDSEGQWFLEVFVVDP